MADNNSLVFYQQWAVAWLQMDKYSTNPWCVDSKNLDIFSDTQSAKGTAWSAATAMPPVDYVDVDEKGRFYLYANWNVYDSVEDVTYDHTYYDNHAEKIDWEDWNWYVTQPFGTPVKLFVKYVWDDWNMIVVITTTLKYYIPKNWIWTWLNSAFHSTWVAFEDEWMYKYHRIKWQNANAWWANVIPKYRTARTKFYLLWRYWNFSTGTINIAKSSPITYDPTTKTLNNPRAEWVHVIWKFTQTDRTISLSEWSSDPIGTSVQDWNRIKCEAYISWNINTTDDSWQCWIRIDAQSLEWNWILNVEDTYIKENWVYLKPLANRDVVQIDDKWYMQVWENEYEEMEWMQNYDSDNNPYWTLITTWSFPLPEWQSIAAITKTFDYRLVFVNLPDYNLWRVYLVPAGDDILNFQQCWEFPWLKFINAIMVNWYSYVIAEERGIRWLYVFYNWQTKKIVGADTKYTESESLMDGKEIYNFTWEMINWRSHVVAPTINGIYMYWENKRWQNVWSFILKIDWTITKLFVDQYNQLRVEYTSWANSYYKIYQDDIVKKNYESDWSITYPVQIWSHMLEKEVRDLEVSYSLPNSSTSMDVFVSVNDYYFWSFLTSWVVTAPDVWAKFKASWLSWNYWLEFVEKDWNWLTFKLTWDLPYQTLDTKNLVSEDNQTTIAYTDFNHFKKIGTCSKTDPFMKEGKARIFKIATDNELPIVRKMQIRVDGHTDTHNSPLLYSIRLLSDQKDR